MGKKLKVGKSRKDRFYHLAKETGYRSRAAFKLIQLNRKFEFLQRSNIIIDLCAAPGGWLQVAAENAPMSNVIIGIDLVPITPIRNVKTFQEDITSEKCRQILRKELHTAKADCVLNDGAPNVGKNWLHDAYQQAELTLHALRLATDFLRKGGWFITKVFRSKDYDPLLWVFGQLFKNVHATKPQASRSESAEIFVVCQGFLAPDKIDPKFLDPKCVFQEVDTTPRPSIDLIHPEKKRRQREGYPEGDYTLFYSLPVSQFLSSDDYMNLLAQSSEIALDSEEIKNHPLTTSEIRECIKDIKVLGKKEIKAIFTWRKKLKKEHEKKQEEIIEDEKVDKTEEKEEENVEDKDDAEVEELETLLEQKNQEELAAMKKAKKKIRKAQMKQKIRIDMKMTIPGDMPDIQDDINIFDIKKIRNPKQLNDVEKGDLSYLDKEDIFEDSDDEGKPKYRPREYYDKDVKVYRGVAAGDSSEEEDMEEEPTFTESQEAETPDHGEDDRGEEAAEDDDENEEDGKDTSANPLIVDLGETQRIRQDKQTAWFQKAAFADLDDDLDDVVELSQIASIPEDKTGKTQKKKKAKPKQTLEDGDSGFDVDDSESEEVEDNSEEEDEDDDSELDEEDGDYDFNEALGGNKRNKKTGPAKSSKIDGIEVVPKSSLDPSEQLDSEGLAIGAAMIQSRKRKREILDSAYHRYMFDDDNLPDWFVTDEKRHVKVLRPVSKEEMEEYKLKMKAIDAQPIKKIAEAKARKKKKLLVRREKARKKANAISDSMDVSEKEKWQQIKQVYKKAGLLNKTKQSITYVVAKKGAGKKVRRPAGVKGHFKVVDGRMKKDVRAQKKKEGKGGKRKGKKSGHKGRS